MTKTIPMSVIIGGWVILWGGGLLEFRGRGSARDRVSRLKIARGWDLCLKVKMKMGMMAK